VIEEAAKGEKQVESGGRGWRVWTISLLTECGARRVMRVEVALHPAAACNQQSEIQTWDGPHQKQTR
jgi:hypothetical protein